MAYSTVGPICPHCAHQHEADEPFYFDEDQTSFECQRCDKPYEVHVFTQTSWSTGDDA